jgi:hypothetical protein
VSICTWCSIKVLRTCVQVLGRQQAKRGSGVKCGPLEQTARYRVGQSKQEYTWGKRSSKRFSLTLDRGHEGHIHKVLQEEGCSSMYKDIAMNYPHEKNLPGLCVLFCMLRWLLAMHYCPVFLNWAQYWLLLFSLPWLSYMRYLPHIIKLSAILIVVYFHRLKMNHDSH